MSNKISELSSKRSKLIADAQALANSNAAGSPEYKAIISQLDLIQEDLDTVQKIERMLPSAIVTSNVPAPVATPAPTVAPAVITQRDSAERRKALNDSFRSLLLHGYNGTRPEQRDITIATDGAVVIPQEFSHIITEAQKFYGPIANLVKRIDSDNGRPQKQVISDDTASTMTYIAETGGTSGVEADPTLQSTIPGTDSLVSLVKYSRQELEDADDLEGFISGIAGLRVARSVEYALTLGRDNGTNTALPNSPAGGLLASAPVGTTTASLAAGIGYDDLIALAAGSVDHAYWAEPGSGFMASPATFSYLLSQKDGEGRPYYNVDPATGLLMIAGKPLYINNAMPSYTTASTKAVLFGDLSRAYSYLNGSGVGGMKLRVLKERFSDVFEGAAIIYTRLGAATLVSGAVKALETAAS